MAAGDTYSLELSDGTTWDVRLNAGAVRYAELAADVEIDMREVMSAPMAFGAKLVWVAVLPDHPDLEEQDVARALAKADDGDEAIKHVLTQLNDSLEIFEEQLGNVRARLQKENAEAIRQMEEAGLLDELARSLNGAA